MVVYCIYACIFSRTSTNLPLGKTQLHTVAAFGLDTRAFLQRPADHTGSDSEVTVVAVYIVEQVLV